jgi:sugar lactone lactonase YvrE
MKTRSNKLVGTFSLFIVFLLNNVSSVVSAVAYQTASCGASQTCSVLPPSSDLFLQVIAGTGVLDYSGDGGSAVEATLKSATSVWADLQGNAYIVDKTDNRVRCVNDTTGMITTVLGTGDKVFVSDGGVGIDIPLYSPSACVGSAEDQVVFVSDKYHIWKYDVSSGIASCYGGAVDSTIGSDGDGGAATAAHLNNPTGMWLCTDGSLYIAETDAGKVRMIDNTGIISTVAGSGLVGFGGDGEIAVSPSVLFSSPTGCYVNSNGALYIADQLNARIRMVFNGIISTCAGGGTSLTEGILATNYALTSVADVCGDSMGNLYISELTNHNILKVDSNAIITRFLGSGNAGISYGIASATSSLATPCGLYIDQTNCILYETETDLGMVKKSLVLPSNTCSSSSFCSVSPNVENLYMEVIAGTGLSQYSGDGGMGTQSSFKSMRDVWADLKGNIFIVDTVDNRVRAVDDETGIVTTIMGTGSQIFTTSDEGLAVEVPLYSPEGCIGDVDRNLLFISDKYHIWQYNITSQYATCYSGCTGHQISASTGDGGDAVDAFLNNPSGMWLDTDGTLYFAESGSQKVRAIFSTGLINTVAGSGDTGYDGDGESAISPVVKMNSPCGCYVDTNGALYVADQLNARVRVVTNGVISTCAGGGSSTSEGSPATSFALGLVGDVCGDVNGNLYISDMSSHKIYQLISSSGLIYTFLGTGQVGLSLGISQALTSPLNTPCGLFIDSANCIFYETEVSGCVLKKSAFSCIPPAKSPTSLPCPPLNHPTAVPTSNPGLFPVLLPILVPHSSPAASPQVPSVPHFPTAPFNPSSPTSPAFPSLPSSPSVPTSPSTPSVPTSPSVPSSPTSPSVPSVPTNPSVPSVPHFPSAPFNPSSPSTPTSPGVPASPSVPSVPTNPSVPTAPSVVSQAPIGPTKFPTKAPVGPTKSPTKAPVGPTLSPSHSPSSFPSSTPSSLPSIQHTLAPNTNDRIEIKGKLVLNSVSAAGQNFLSGTSLNCMLDAVYSVSSTPSVCEILSATKVSGPFSVLASAYKQRNSLLLVPLADNSTDDYDVTFLNTYYMRDNPGYQTLATASMKEGFIRTMVENGTFQSALRMFGTQYNIADYSSTSCDQVSLETTIYTDSITSNSDSASAHNNRLTPGQIAGITVGCFVGGLLIALLMIYFFNLDGTLKQHPGFFNSSQELPQTEPAETAAADGPAVVTV